MTPTYDNNLVEFEFNIVPTKLKTKTRRIILYTTSDYKLVTSANTSVWDLPPYIEKCSISDPDLNVCFKEKANRAIPRLAKGDADFGIPPTSPTVYSKSPVYGDGFTMNLYDVFNDDTKNLWITDLEFDLEKGILDFTAVLNRSYVGAQNYEIVNGTFQGITATGSGKFNLTLVDIVLRFKGNVTEYQKFNETYLELKYNLSARVGRAYYFFENLSPLNGSSSSGQQLETDVNAYIDLNWQAFWSQLNPSYEAYMGTFIYYPFGVILSKVPKRKLFLP
ncbi:hypothetical protein Trydic_g9015 [Trypoxylus dichotomus]